MSGLRGVAVGVGVLVGTGVSVGVGVLVGSGVGDGVWGVAVGSAVGVRVGVGEAAIVGICVAVAGGVGVDAAVSTSPKATCVTEGATSSARHATRITISNNHVAMFG